MDDRSGIKKWYLHNLDFFSKTCNISDDAHDINSLI